MTGQKKERRKQGMKQTIKVADKPTADEIKQTVESNAEKLDGIVQELESGGMLSDPNLGLAALKQSLDELKNYVGNGKRDVASAITGKGIPTATDASFAALVQNIDKIVTLMQGIQDANAGAGQILNGYTAYVKGSKVSGTIPSQGAQTITPGTSAKYVEAGRYLSGRQTIAGDANLAAANIVKGKSIFGVAGTHTGGNFYCKQLLSNADASATIPKESVYLDFIPTMAAVMRICTVQYSQSGYANGTAVKVIIPTRPNSSFRDQTNIYTSGSVALPAGVGGSTILSIPINIYMTSQDKQVWLDTGDNNNGDAIDDITLGKSNNNVWLVIC